jgi:ABC-2 type transport system ATP-binding protein
MTPIIQVENLSKIYKVADKDAGIQGTLSHFFKRRYKQIPAVQNVSFSIEPGEIVGFLGANGAGKTTTLKMLTGLIHPSHGLVRVADYIPYRRQNGFLQQITLIMGQKQQLIWDLPALDSLRINSAVYGLTEGEFKQRNAGDRGQAYSSCPQTLPRRTNESRDFSGVVTSSPGTISG